MWWLLPIASAEPLTLASALERAVEDNLEIQEQRHNNALAQLRLAQARSVFVPSATASTQLSSAQTPTNNAFDGATLVVTSSSQSVSVGLSQVLPTGGSLSTSYTESVSTSDSANAASAQFVSTRTDLSLSQPVLRGAGLWIGTAVLSDAQLEISAQRLAWRRALEQLVIEVGDAYWGLVAARRSRDLSEHTVSLAEEQLSQTLERQREGFAGSGDVLQVQISVGQAQLQRVEARAAEVSAQARLARVIGHPVAESASLDPTEEPEVLAEPPDRDVLLQRAQEDNVDLLLAKIEHTRSVRAARRASNEALPDLSVDASFGWSSGAERAPLARLRLIGVPSPSWGVGVQAGLPLSTRALRSELGIAKLQLQQAELRLHAAQEDLVLAVDDALRTIARDRAGLEVANQTLDHAHRSLAAQRELLSEGRGSTRDVVDALDALRSAEASRLSAEIACQQSLLRAHQVSGSLLTRAGLSLDEP